MNSTINFRGRTVLVTGGARGIGLELSRQLVAKGAHVVAVGRDAATLDALAEELQGHVLTRVADLRTPGAAEELAAWMAATHPACSVLVNNAAIMLHLDLTTNGPSPLEPIDREIATNLTAPLQLSVAMLPVLRTRPSAAIVNVTSGLAIAPKRDAAVYCATKAALRSFTRSLRDQCRAAGLPIQVTEVVMTVVDTTLSRGPSAGKYAPARAAADIITGVEAGRDEVWVERTRLLRAVHRLSPRLAYRLMRER